MNRIHRSFPLDLLSNGSKQTHPEDSVVDNMRQLIINAFAQNSIDIISISYVTSPSVIRFEFTPSPGIKMSNIRSCEDDLAEALADYGSVRLIAPVPGNGTIAVEVPRPNRQIVRLKEVLESKEFQESNFKLPVALGVSSENKPIVNDLFGMEDIFIGGVTGTGKSMLMHNIIASLIYAKRPEQLKFVLIDTKNVEFNAYSKLQFSYLATFNNKPAVITDPKDVLKVLDSLIYERNKRHFIQLHVGVPFIYNDLQQPSIVVIIDEISDLIKLYGEEVLRRLYKLVGCGKSAGIHVICASQNCSSEINRFIYSFQARISFNVYSEVDSIRIIVKPDATQLFDKGDMLLHWEQSDRFVDGILEHFERIQSCLHDTDEIIEMCNYLKSPQTLPYGLPTQSNSSYKNITTEKDMENARDPLFEEAARFIVESQNASKSMLQRRFSIGYARAHKLMDQLEKAGIVGSHKGEVSLDELLDLLDEEYSPCEYKKLPYEDYIIIGDTAEIDKMCMSKGYINLDIPDFLRTLSKDTVNYVSTGRAEGPDCVVNALADALHKLPIEIEAISKLLFNVWTPKVMQFHMNEMKSMADFINVLSMDIDIVWGFACDESMEGRQARVSLIAASK